MKPLRLLVDLAFILVIFALALDAYRQQREIALLRANQTWQFEMNNKIIGLASEAWALAKTNEMERTDPIGPKIDAFLNRNKEVSP